MIMMTLSEKMKREMTLRGMAAGTQRSYLKMVSKLYEYHNKYPLAKLTEEQIKTYLLHIYSKGKMPASTYNTNIAALRFFYKVVLYKPMSKCFLPQMKPRKKLPDILSASEVEQIIKAARNIKQRTMFVVAYGAGLRSSEIKHLRIRDIDSKRMVMHICNGKGGKDRYAILPPTVLKTLRVYWEKCRSKIKCQEDWLFPGRNPHQPISNRAIQDAFTKTKARAGITKLGCIHSLRHAFATHSLEAGIDLYTIKELLGHALIKTTARYLHMTTKQIGEAKAPIDKLDI